MTTMLQEAVSCITLKVPHVLCDLTLLRNNGFLIQRICQFYESWRVPPFNRRTLQNLCRLKFSSQEAQHIESTTLVRTLSLPIQPMAIFFSYGKGWLWRHSSGRNRRSLFKRDFVVSRFISMKRPRVSVYIMETEQNSTSVFEKRTRIFAAATSNPSFFYLVRRLCLYTIARIIQNINIQDADVYQPWHSLFSILCTHSRSQVIVCAAWQYTSISRDVFEQYHTRYCR